MNRDSTWLKKFDNEGNWTDFYFTNYVFGKKIFVILSTCCVHQGVHNLLLVKVRAMVQDLYNLIILSGSSNPNLEEILNRKLHFFLCIVNPNSFC